MRNICRNRSLTNKRAKKGKGVEKKELRKLFSVSFTVEGVFFLCTAFAFRSLQLRVFFTFFSKDSSKISSADIFVRFVSFEPQKFSLYRKYRLERFMFFVSSESANFSSLSRFISIEFLRLFCFPLHLMRVKSDDSRGRGRKTRFFSPLRLQTDCCTSNVFPISIFNVAFASLVNHQKRKKKEKRG